MADINMSLSLLLIGAVLTACFLLVFIVIVLCEQYGQQLISFLTRKYGEGEE